MDIYYKNKSMIREIIFKNKNNFRVIINTFK